MDALLAHCAAFFTGHGSLFAVFFLGGLTGSLTHCLTMCGPVVACQAACGSCTSKLSAASLWQYHAGRLITYSALGFACALLSKQIAAMPYWGLVSRGMMIAAGVLFIASAAFPARHRMLSFSPSSTFLRGVLMSFMPCGLLYAALMMAATLASPLHGAAAMAFFVLGTLPVLFTASTGAALLARRWYSFIHHAGRAGMAFNGLLLLGMATSIMR